MIACPVCCCFSLAGMRRKPSRLGRELPSLLRSCAFLMISPTLYLLFPERFSVIITLYSLYSFNLIFFVFFVGCIVTHSLIITTTHTPLALSYTHVREKEKYKKSSTDGRKHLVVSIISRQPFRGQALQASFWTNIVSSRESDAPFFYYYFLGRNPLEIGDTRTPLFASLIRY